MAGNQTQKPAPTRPVLPEARGEPSFHIALLEPEIPQNTGNIGRLCLGVGARLHLVHPLGFDLDEKAVRRAGLDYWRHVDLQEHADTNAFFTWAAGRRIYLLSSLASRPYTAIPFAPGDVYVFGRESVGLPPTLVAAHGGWVIPMVGPTRSLNLANAVSIIAYAAFARIDPARFVDPGPP